MVLMLELLGVLAAVVALFFFCVWFFTLPRVELWLGIGDTAYKLRCGRGSELGDLVPQPPPPTGPIHWPDVKHFRKPFHNEQAGRP